MLQLLWDVPGQHAQPRALCWGGGRLCKASGAGTGDSGEGFWMSGLCKVPRALPAAMREPGAEEDGWDAARMLAQAGSLAGAVRGAQGR